jgi:hypothetical protein
MADHDRYRFNIDIETVFVLSCGHFARRGMTACLLCRANPKLSGRARGGIHDMVLDPSWDRPLVEARHRPDLLSTGSACARPSLSRSATGRTEHEDDS